MDKATTLFEHKIGVKPDLEAITPEDHYTLLINHGDTLRVIALPKDTIISAPDLIRFHLRDLNHEQKWDVLTDLMGSLWRDSSDLNDLKEKGINVKEMLKDKYELKPEFTILGDVDTH